MLDITPPTDAADMQKFRFSSAGRMLAGRIYRPIGLPEAIVVLNGAVGVPQRFYEAFARWLSHEKNVACLTFDYDGIGESTDGDLRNNTASMVRWGVTDQTAARDSARHYFPDTPIWVIGHSLGGMTLPFQKRISDIERFIAVCSGPVHTSDHPWDFRPAAWVFWSAPVAVLTRMLGYFPARLFGMGENLTATAYLQWRRWCSKKGFYFQDIGRDLPQPDWTRADASVRLVALSDDKMIPPHCVQRLADLYQPGSVDYVEVTPKDHGMGKVGHINVFSRKNSALWDHLLGDTTKRKSPVKALLR